jgi:hypothetical protein
MCNLRYLAMISLMLAACTQQPTQNLGVALKGIEKSRFVACAGPPVLELPQGGQDRMSFVTNLKRGDAIGASGPNAFAPASCSVDAIFENSRLVSANFSGNLSMCQLVFSPCLQR